MKKFFYVKVKACANKMLPCLFMITLFLSLHFIFTSCPNKPLPNTPSVKDLSVKPSIKPDGTSDEQGVKEKVTIKFDDANITVWKEDIGDTMKKVINGLEIQEGTLLYFRLETFLDGKKIDKWIINTKELSSAFYVVDKNDAKVENGTKVIEITYTTKSAEPVTIKFDDTKIKVFVNKGNHLHQISNNSIHYEGRKLSIKWKGSLPDGQKIDKCYMNEKLFSYDPYDKYRIDIADAITEGSAKVINIGCILTTAEPIIIKFDDTKIKVKLNDSEISDGTTLYGGRILYFSLKVPLPISEQLDSWIINGKTRVLSVYYVDESDAVLENGVKVIRVTYKAKSA